MLTDAQLAEIERRLRCLDGESWSVSPVDAFVVDTGCPMELIQNGKFARDEWATFVANAPNDIRRLLEEVRRR